MVRKMAVIAITEVDPKIRTGGYERVPLLK